MNNTKRDYPLAWEKGIIQRQIYDLANWRCEHCGMEFVRGTTKAVSARNRNGKAAILTVHHLDGNPANCLYENLVAVCQACHLHIQAIWKPGNMLPQEWWPEVPEWITERELAYIEPPVQLELFGTRS